MTDDRTPAYAPPQPLSPSDERMWATLIHVGGIIIGFIAPLLGYLLLKDRSAFVGDNAKNALNFQITLLGIQIVAYIIGTILLVVVIGFLFYLVAWAAYIAGLILSIVAFLKAKDGHAYRYPFALRLIK